MGWFATWRFNNAAKQYARRLPQGLKQGWGHSKTYTQGQTDAAARKQGLDPRFILIGYAAFLTADDLATLQIAPSGFTANEAAAAFDRWRPVPGGWGDNGGAAGGEAYGGGYDGGGHHGGGGGHH